MQFVNEWRYCLRQPIVLIGLIISLIFSLLLTAGTEQAIYSESHQLSLTQITLLMLVLPILLSVISPIIFLRDSTYNMTELIESTPVTYKRRWLLRYAAAVSIVFLLFALCFSVVLISYALEYGLNSKFIVQSLFNLFLLTLPSILFGAAIAIFLAVFKQSAMFIYTCFAAIGIGYLLLASMTGSPILAGSSVINNTFYNNMLWLDPHGITAVIDNINSTNTYLSHELLINRAAYILLSCFILYFALNQKKPKRIRHQCIETTTDSENKKHVHDKKLIVYRLPSSANTALLKVSVLTLLNQRVTQVILIVWPMLIFNEVLSGISYAEPLSVLSPNSIDALNRFAFDLLPVLGTFIVALWSWFICSYDKNCNIAELIASSPISNRQLITAHISALWLMVILLLILTFIGSSIAEWIANSEWQLSHYLIQLSLNAIPLMILSTIFVTIYHIFRSKLIAGCLVLLILIIKFTPVTTSLGITHTLWNIGDTPLQEPDNFWGYSNSASVYLPYISIWLIVCISLLCLTNYTSHRNTGLGKLSLKKLPKTLLIPLSVVLFACVVLHLALVDEKPLYNSDMRETWKAQYETHYNCWQFAPQPSITHIDSAIDIYPEQQTANVKLNYTLENRTNAPIEKVLVGRYGNYGFGKIILDRAKLIEFNTELNQGIYQFSSALLPGEKRNMQAEFTFNQPQLWPHRSHQVVKPEFSYLRSSPLIPTIGYQADYQLNQTQLRDKYLLANNENIAPSMLFKNENILTSDDNTNTNSRNYQWVTLSTVISTATNHSAISQGELVNSWQNGQRSYFKFKTKVPVRAIPAWLSVPFTPLSKTVRGTTLNVYAPDDSQAAQLHIKAMADTLDWFTNNVSAYSGTQLNLVATPDLGLSGYALPQILLINNNLGFRAEPSPNAGFDQRYRRTVHETAHQWFGHGLGNGVSEDRSFLVESMVKYIELVVIEKGYGRDAMNALIDYEKKRFELAERNNLSPTVALIDATQTHDIHSRATIVFARLREIIGDARIIAAIKYVWQQHAYPQAPATSMDFVRSLKRHSETRHHSLINDLLLEGLYENDN